MDSSSHESLVHYLRKVVHSGRSHGDLVSLPTLILPLTTVSTRSEHSQCIEERVLAWFKARDFDGDRTIPLSLHGYPGLLNELSEPAPWVNVELDDCDGPVSPEREHELQPLYLRLAEEEQLSRDFHHLVTQQCDLMDRLGLLENLRPPPRELDASVASKATLLSMMVRMRLDGFKRLIHLGRVLGPSMVEALNESVFKEVVFQEGVEIDKFPPYTGCPDLLLWTRNAQEAYWFFAEVKGRHDRLRQTQVDWIRSNWERIQGRMVIISAVE